MPLALGKRPLLSLQMEQLASGKVVSAEEIAARKD